MALGHLEGDTIMWLYEKRLLHPVSIKRANPRMARLLQEPYAGRSSALGAALTYLNQRFSSSSGTVRALLTDIGTEELAHYEMLGSMITQCLAGAGLEDIKKAGLENWFAAHRRGPFLADSNGVPWTAAAVASTGDAVADLAHDLAAEQHARAVYEGLIAVCDDESIAEPLEFLRQREIVHASRFCEALELVRKDEQ